MSRPLVVLTIVALLAACSGESSVTAPPGSSTSRPVASTMDSAPVATTSTPTSVTSTTLTVDTSWLGQGWTAAGGDLSPSPHAYTVTKAQFGLVAVGWACPEESGCPAAAWVSTDGLNWTGTVPGEHGLDDVTLYEVVTFGPSVFAAGGSCTQNFLHPDDCGAAIFSSDDGLHWTLAAHDVFPDCTEATFSDCNMFANGLTTDGNTLIALVDEPLEEGSVKRPWASTDGVEWEKATSTDEAPLNIERVVTASSGFVGVGTKWSTDGQVWWESFAVWDSPDGYTWSEVSGLEPSDVEDVFLGRVAAWTGGIAAFGEVCDIDWVNCFQVVWHSADGREWTRTVVEGELADITSGALTAFGIKDLLVIAGGIEDTPYLASTRDLNDWDIYAVDPDLFNPHDPLFGLIEHDLIVIGVSGGSPGIVVNQQETS
jgi:hypothetical protein